MLDYQRIPTIPEEELIKRLSQRKGFIDGVCITGGEPTIEEELVSFCRRLKGLRLKVKVDTNGYLPQRVEELIEKRAVDYIALDIKSSPKRYSLASGLQVDLRRIEKSIALLIDSGVEYELRTTFVPGFVDEGDLKGIGELVKGGRLYVLQQFRPGTTLDPSLSRLRPYPADRLRGFAEVMRSYVDRVEVRGT